MFSRVQQIILLLIVLLGSVLAQKLDNFEQEIEGNDEEKADITSEESESQTHISFSGELSMEGIETMIQVAGSVFYGSYELMFHIPAWGRAIPEFGYADYPYAESDAGLYQTGNLKPWSINAQLDYFYMNDNLTGLIFRTFLSPHPYFSFQINYSQLMESESGTTDDLELIDIHLNYNRIKDEHLALWWGVGFKVLRGNVVHSGPALNFGAEYYPVQPVSFGINYNIAFFEKSTVDNLQLLTNIHVNRLKLTAGFQKFRAGDISFPGMLAGLGIYF